jgi:UDP-N-acetylglucosamine 3-dehydrogenase
METLKAAVVGVGAMGVNHCRVYSELGNVELTGVCDVDGKSAKKAASKFDCDGFSDVDALLAKVKPDIVSVVVPTQHHCECALKIIGDGCGVLVEKPIADTEENAKRIIEAAEEADVRLMVGHIERFNPAVQMLKRRLMAGHLGRIYTIKATRVGPFPHRIRDVGVVIDLAVHDIDSMRYVTESEVVRVYAETEKRIHTTCEDMLSGLLKFESGVVGALDVNWLTPEKIREIAVTGERGMFVVKYIPQELMFYENRHMNGRSYDYKDILMGVLEGDIVNIRVEKKEPLKNELEAFINAVRKDKTPPVTGEDGLRSLQVAQALIESATENKAVQL